MASIIKFKHGILNNYSKQLVYVSNKDLRILKINMKLKLVDYK